MIFTSHKNTSLLSILILIILLLSSCVQEKETSEIYIPYLDTNILEGYEYIPYEDEIRESEGIGDDYFLKSSEGYNCWNIKERGKFSLPIDFSDTFCDDWKIYKGHQVISFVYYDRGFESLPKLGYKMLFFHPEKGYIDYIIPEDQLDFQHYASIQMEHINKKVSEGAEFPNEKWGELYEYMSTWLKKDFNHDTDIAWIRDEHEKINKYISKYLLSFASLQLGESSWGLYKMSDGDYNCGNLPTYFSGEPIEEYRSDLCSVFDDGERKLIYFFYLANHPMSVILHHSIEKQAYLIDKESGYISLVAEELSFPKFFPNDYKRYEGLDFGTLIDDGNGYELYDGVSPMDLQEVDNKILKDIYLNSPEIENEFLRFKKHIKENYLR